MAKVVVTRGIRQGQKFVQDFCTRYSDFGYECFLYAPVIDIESVPVEIQFKDYDCVLATSQNALAFVPEGVRSLHVGQVGIRDVAALIEHIKTEDREHRFLYLRGEDVSFDLAGATEKLGFLVDEAVVYRARAVDNFSDEFVKGLQRGDVGAVSLFSRRSAQIFFELSQKCGVLPLLKGIKVLCLSRGVLDCIPSVFNGDVRTAQQPDADSMVKLVKDYFDECRE